MYYFELLLKQPTIPQTLRNFRILEFNLTATERINYDALSLCKVEIDQSSVARVLNRSRKLRFMHAAKILHGIIL